MNSLRAIAVVLCSTVAAVGGQTWLLPIGCPSRTSVEGVALTPIGAFGAPRKARPGIPAHLHTGVDLRRPSGNYVDEPVYPASKGMVVSVRSDGPFAQIIIAHFSPSCWTVYEHLAGITRVPGDSVSPGSPIGRFFTREELDRHGWQFDHLHFEVMRTAPRPVKPNPDRPNHWLTTYALDCLSRSQLDERMVDPLVHIRAAQHHRITQGD